jgi:opacity protein-like surface antigen
MLKMNKKIIAVVLFSFSALNGYSQLSWNVKAGMNVSRVTNWYDETDLKPGYQLGAGMDYFFTDHWGVQSSLMLISKGFKTKGDYYRHFGDPIEPLPSGWSFKDTQHRIYVEMPVMLAYRFNVSNSIKFVLSGGGYIGYGIAGKYKCTSIYEDGSEHKDSFNTFSPPFGPHGYSIEKFDFGIGAGMAFEYKNRYTIGLIGEWGLKKIVGVSKNQSYGLNVGYKF